MRNHGNSTNDHNDSSRTSGGCCFLKLFLRAIAVVGLFWILMVGSPDGKASFLAGSTKKFKGLDRVLARTEKVVHGPKLDRIAYMSKRRVPNGPDPIHNRRAGKSGKLPGQA